MKTKRKKAVAKKPTLHLAVIVSKKLNMLGSNMDLTLIQSRRTKGDWASFLGFDLVKVVEQARQAMDEWNVDGPGAPYEILVGSIDWRAEFPVEFTLKPLGASR